MLTVLLFLLLFFFFFSIFKFQMQISLIWLDFVLLKGGREVSFFSLKMILIPGHEI